MRSHPKLTCLALGSIQVYSDERLLTGWAYLDSAELLFYLLQHTLTSGKTHVQTDDRQGLTKQQIGLALWPDATPNKLSSRLKSRLHDLRRVLGDGDWILFENGRYQFNAAWPYAFDVEDFEYNIAEAERLRQDAPAQAIVHYEAAVRLYRGDFLADLRPRRARKGRADEYEDAGAGREWQMSRADELLSTYLDALHKLGTLATNAGRFELAANAFRQGANKDDYDDDFHFGLMYGLARQGKRSQALEHFRRLLERRSDTPPLSELIELANRLRRGEELGPKSHQMELTQPIAQTVESAAPFQAPADLPRFVGRGPELDWLREKLAAGSARDDAPGSPYGLVGMGGIGKTSLAIHLAHVLRPQFADGVLWCHVSTSEPLAILDSWARAFGCDFSSLPDLDSRAAALRAVLADRQVLMILDDVWDAARARALLVGGPRSTVLLTGRDQDVAAALDAQIIGLPTLAPAESRQLLARIVGEARVRAELAEADEIGELLGYLPLALDIAAHRLASRQHWTLGEFVVRLRARQRRLSELKLGDREVRASFAMSWEVLEEPARQVFASLAVFAGRSFSTEALAAVVELDERVARDQADALVSLSLLSQEHGERYRQHSLLADFALEHLDQVAAAESRMALHFARYAATQRQDYQALEDEWDNLAAGFMVSQQQKLWQAILDYGDVLSIAWLALGRYSYARQAYPLICQAARELEEQESYIAAVIDWGRACIEQGDYVEAETRLQHAVQTCQDVNDQYGTATARYHLGRVALQRANYEQGQQLLAESQQTRERLGDRIGVAETLIQQARIHYRHYNYIEVEQLARRAYETLSATDRYQQTLEALRLMALAASHQGLHAAADELCQRAAVLCERAQYRSELPNILYTWMQLDWRRGDLAGARDHGERSVALFKMTGARNMLGYALEYLTRVYLDLQDYVLAEERGGESLSLLRDLRDDWGLVYAWRGLGKLYRQTNRPTEARQAWTEALRKADAINHPLRDELQSLLRQL